MKLNSRRILGLIFALMVVVITTSTAQESTNMPAIPTATSLPQTILDYISKLNPNLATTFADNRFDLWTGASSLQGGPVPMVNDIGLSYDIWRPQMANTNVAAAKVAISLEDGVRNSGVAGTLVSDNFGLGISFIIVDVKLTFYADGGVYLGNSTRSAEYYAELGLRAKKAIGAHFYTGVGIGAQLPKNAQVFSAFAGATF